MKNVKRARENIPGKYSDVNIFKDMNDYLLLDDIKIPKKSFQLLRQSICKNYKRVPKDKGGIDYGVENQYNLYAVISRFEDLVSKIKIKNLSTKKILEIGCGSGLFLTYLRKKGIDAYAIEPDKYSYESAKLLLRENDFPLCVKQCVGEKIDFPDNTFDLVVSYQVLEHTQDPLKVLAETRRVLKDDGLIFFVIPNYFSFWEGHYALPWLPFFNTPQAKLYVALLGRDPDFLDTLHFITPRKLLKWSDELGLTVLFMGEDEFKAYLGKSRLKVYWSNNKQFVRFVCGAVKIVRMIGIASLIATIFTRLGLYYPIYYCAKKRKNDSSCAKN